MTEQQHPITPPPELVRQLWDSYSKQSLTDVSTAWKNSVIAAFRAGADQELEACCEWLDQNTGRWDLLAKIRTARRPKPPSFKEEALKMLDNLERCTDGKYYTIRFALEQLND